MNSFENIRHFNASENWGDVRFVSPLLLAVLDAYRHDLKIPLYVSRCVGWLNKHSAHFPDPLSTGVDVFPLLSKAPEKTLLDCFLRATQFPFRGIGMYPYWKWTRKTAQGEITEAGGLHLDVWPKRILPQGQSTGHWIGIPGEDDEYEYLGVTSCNLKMLGLL